MISTTFLLEGCVLCVVFGCTCAGGSLALINLKFKKGGQIY